MRSLRYLIALSRGFRARLFFSLALGVFSVLFGFAFIYVSKCLVDIATGRLEADFWSYVMLLVTILVSRLAVTSLRIWMSGKVTQQLVNGLRLRYFSQVLNAPWQGREGRLSGDVMSRLGEDLRVVCGCLADDIPALFLALFQLGFAAWFLFTLQPRLLVVLLVIMPVALVLSKVYYKTMRQLTQQVRREEASIQSHMQESVLNRALLLSLSRTALMSDRLVSRQDQLLSTVCRRLRFNIRARVLVQLGFSIGYYTAFVWSALGLMDGSVTYGMMTALLQLVAQVQSPILNLASLFPSVVKATTSAERLHEIGGEGAPVVAHAPLFTLADAPCGLRLDGVTFRYPDGDADVLSDLSYTFAPGSTTAIVGPTGRGKSTLIRLLLGLLRPQAGTITFLDAEGRPMTLAEGLRSHYFAYVPQGNSLFSGTIRDNLLLGKLDATDDELRDALARASALFVYDLPQGLDTPCGEKGGGLSEGQAQRLAIARALLQPGQILVLDEASSALDADTERQILVELRQQQLRKTLIWVTHHAAVSEVMGQVVSID